jgi:hypothetical protein
MPTEILVAYNISYMVDDILEFHSLHKEVVPLSQCVSSKYL